MANVIVTSRRGKFTCDPPPDARLQPEQVLQQPHARHAMNRRHLEGDPADLAIREIEQLLLQRRVIQVSPPLAFGRPPDPHARMPAQVVELPQAALRQQIVNEQAAPAAKHFVVLGQVRVRARLAAVETRRFLLIRAGRHPRQTRGVEHQALQALLRHPGQTLLGNYTHATGCD